MKTPIFRDFDSKFAAVNDQLCYFFFADNEINEIIDSKICNAGDKYTTEIFPDNNFSPKLHVKVCDLPSFRENAFHTLAGTSFIAVVEYMLSYIKDIEDFRSKISPSIHDNEKDNKPEEQLWRKLEGWLGSRGMATIRVKSAG